MAPFFLRILYLITYPSSPSYPLYLLLHVQNKLCIYCISSFMYRLVHTVSTVIVYSFVPLSSWRNSSPHALGTKIHKHSVTTRSPTISRNTHSFSRNLVSDYRSELTISVAVHTFNYLLNSPKHSLKTHLWILYIFNHTTCHSCLI